MGLIKPEGAAVPVPFILNKDITILQSGWAQDGDFFAYKITDAEITPDSVVNVSFSLASMAIAVDAEVQPTSLSADGFCTIYAVSAPESDLEATYSILKAGV